MQGYAKEMFIIGTNQAYAIFGNVFLPLSLVFFSLLFGAMITFYSSVEKKPKTSAGGPQSNPSDNPEDESWTKWFKDNWHWIALGGTVVLLLVVGYDAWQHVEYIRAVMAGVAPEDPEKLAKTLAWVDSEIEVLKRIDNPFSEKLLYYLNDFKNKFGPSS